MKVTKTLCYLFKADKELLLINLINIMRLRDLKHKDHKKIRKN
jgi:hypothetical protein